MINLIDKTLRLQKKLDENYSIIDVSESLGKKTVHINHYDKFEKLSNGNEIKIVDNLNWEYPFKVSFERSDITFFCLVDRSIAENILREEGVKNE
jgi:hypothetical protein